MRAARLRARGLAVWGWLLVVPSAFDSSSGHYGLTNKMSEHAKSTVRLSTMSGFRTDTRRSMDARPVNLEVAVLPDAFGSNPLAPGPAPQQEHASHQIHLPAGVGLSVREGAALTRPCACTPAQDRPEYAWAGPTCWRPSRPSSPSHTQPGASGPGPSYFT